jgi:hypothetical protein
MDALRKLDSMMSVDLFDSRPRANTTLSRLSEKRFDNTLSSDQRYECKINCRC